MCANISTGKVYVNPLAQIILANHRAKVPHWPLKIRQFIYMNVYAKVG